MSAPVDPPIRLREVLGSRGYLRAPREERASLAHGKRILRETARPLLALVAVELGVLAFAVGLDGPLRAEIQQLSFDFAWSWAFGLLEIALGLPIVILFALAVEWCLRALPSRACDRITNGRDSVLWPVGIAMAAAEAWLLFHVFQPELEVASAWGVLVAAHVLVTGTFLWWTVRRWDVWAAVWCRCVVHAALAGALLLVGAFAG